MNLYQIKVGEKTEPNKFKLINSFIVDGGNRTLEEITQFFIIKYPDVKIKVVKIEFIPNIGNDVLDLKSILTKHYSNSIEALNHVEEHEVPCNN